MVSALVLWRPSRTPRKAALHLVVRSRGKRWCCLTGVNYSWRRARGEDEDVGGAEEEVEDEEGRVVERIRAIRA